MNWLKKIKNYIDNYDIKMYHHFFIFLIAFILIVSRRPDVILYPQFWAEDGRIWFEQAYNIGVLKALFIPHTGYFQTFSRLVASFALFFPLKFAPLVFNLVAIFFKILLINLLFSKRFSKIIPELSTKIFLAILYIALPNTSEVFANVTNMHWYLAILAFMVIILGVSKNVWWKIFDNFIIILSGLSGPFVILLIPIAIVRWFIKKDKEFLVPFLLLLICSAIQAYFILMTAFDTRSAMSLGVTIGLFIKIVTGQIFVGAIIGKRGFAWLYNHGFLSNFIYIINFLIGSLIILFVFIKSKWELKSFLVFSGLILLISLAKPMASLSQNQWYILSLPGAGTRYWFIPMLAFVFCLVFLLKKQNSIYIRLLSIILFAIMSVGVVWDWSHHEWEDLHYVEYAEKFEQLPVGEEFKIPIHPKGWEMTLIKK